MLALIAAVVVGATPVGATPEISEVVVYPDRARVTRAASLECSGTGSVAFERLPPSADPGSFRARVDVGTLEGLEVQRQTQESAFSAELETLEAQLQQAEAEARALTEAQERAESLARLGQRYGEVAAELLGGELVEGGNPKGWTTALDAAMEGRLRAAAQMSEVRPKLRAVKERLQELRRKHERLGEAAQRWAYRAEVVVRCPAGRKARVELSYLVGGASWSPVYEARLAESGRAVELTTYANVRQSTGEDWLQARVLLSTAVPRQDATPPELQPLQVWAEERKPSRKVLVRRDERQEHAQSGQGQASAAAPGLESLQQGLSVQLLVPGSSEVRADNSPVRLRVATHRLEAALALRTVPKLAPFVFRVAALRNGAPFPLLAGPVEIFSPGGYLGRMALERVPQGGHFELTFGLEEGFKVERAVVEEVSRATGLFGGNHRFRYVYRLTLASYRPGPEQLEVTEHLPVSEMEDVRVALEEQTTPGWELHKEDGLLRWKVKLNPKEQRVLDLAFHVDVPSSYELGALK